MVLSLIHVWLGATNKMGFLTLKTKYLRKTRQYKKILRCQEEEKMVANLSCTLPQARLEIQLIWENIHQELTN